MKYFIRKIVLFALCTPVLLAAETFRIEAENLSGAWILNKTSAAVGKKLLSVVKKGVPLSGSVTLPAKGNYHVWVRTYDFGEKYRKSTVFIGGKNIGTFGDTAPGAVINKPLHYWHKAEKPVALAAGKIEIKAVSAGGYARLDSIILTTDAKFVPPSDPRKVEDIKELSAAVPTPQKVSRLPEARGKGPAVLLLSGGRPWTAADAAALLRNGGCRVTVLDSRYLAGFGGASTKAFFSDLVEPPKMDGITPAFEQLEKYQLVIFNAIPKPLLAKMLTPARIARLKKYIENGGNVLFNSNAPAALGDLLPVKFGKVKKMDPALTVQLKKDKAFASLPASWKSNAAYIEAAPVKGTCVLGELKRKDGKTESIFLASKKIGKGKSWFWNADWVRLAGTRQLYNWAYGKALWISVAAVSGNFPLSTAGAIFKPQPAIPHRTLGKVTLDIKEPVLKLVPDTSDIIIKGKKILFANKTEVQVSGNGSISIRYPGAKNSLVNLTVPTPVWSTEVEKLTHQSSEAISAERKFSSKIRWKFKSLRNAGKGVAVLDYESGKFKLQWLLQAGSLDLDGRKFYGIKETVNLTAAPVKLERIRSNAVFSPGKYTVRRMACYAGKNRGYMEYDFSGKVNNDSEGWQFFCGGIPFTYAGSPEGIYTEFLDFPIPAHVRFRISAGKAMTRSMMLQCGYRQAPLTLPGVWHMFSTGAERGNNDYLALHQFQRKFLREKTGIKDFAHTTKAIYTNMATPAEIRQSMKYAAANGFKVIRHPWCPSPQESLDNKDRVEMLRLSRNYGLISRPWTAGDYTQGDGTWIYRKHPEWFVRQADGSIVKYFGNHPAMDTNNPEYTKWYFALIERAIANGLGEIYLDMFGQASQNVNYAAPDAKPGLCGVTKFIKFFSDKNIPAGIEGMNPLAQDNWWYRPHLYRNFAGKEFAANGASICGTPESSFSLNFFRAAMFNICVSFDVDGAAMDFDRIPDETRKMNEAVKLIRKLNEVYAKVGFPFIRETSIGSVWMGKEYGAVFVYDNVKELKLNLPAKWQAVNSLKNISRESIILLKKGK